MSPDTTEPAGAQAASAEADTDTDKAQEPTATPEVDKYPTCEEVHAKVDEALKKLELSIRVKFVPQYVDVANMRETVAPDKWWFQASPKFEVTVFRAGKELITVPYSMGLGCFPQTSRLNDMYAKVRYTKGRAAADTRFTLLNAYYTAVKTGVLGYPVAYKETQNSSNYGDMLRFDHQQGERKHPGFKSDLCHYVTLSDVMYSLCMDSSALDYPKFEEWAREFGFDEDSRKGEQTYAECVRIGLSMARGLGYQQLEQLREIFSGY